ncbi:unnamed protein product [Miscanthus lutarioriparius]|uniref:Uncharacterized protein n=1 Tax=Miscanthus lutarioriparius TaxID=422564 RepID=A0A811NWV0_9POAL|nr:unnamed protein product [Miscanthus lutarioriparius]
MSSPCFSVAHGDDYWAAARHRKLGAQVLSTGPSSAMVPHQVSVGSSRKRVRFCMFNTYARSASPHHQQVSIDGLCTSSRLGNRVVLQNIGIFFGDNEMSVRVKTFLYYAKLAVQLISFLLPLQDFLCTAIWEEIIIRQTVPSS